MPLMRTTSNLSISGIIARVLCVALRDARVKDTFIHVRFQQEYIDNHPAGVP